MRTRARILVVGDSGVGKSSLVHKVSTGKVLEAPGWTVGCTVNVKLVLPDRLRVDLQGAHQQGQQGQQQTAACAPPMVQHHQASQGQRLGHEPFFVELLDVGCHNSHALSRHMYYANVDAIMLVYDVSNVKSFGNMRKWIAELARKVPRARQPARQRTHQYDSAKRIADLPVLVVGNKLDLVRSRARWMGKSLPDVTKVYGFEWTNVSSASKGGTDIIDAWLARVAAGTSDDEVAYASPDPWVLNRASSSPSDMFSMTMP